MSSTVAYKSLRKKNRKNEDEKRRRNQPGQELEDGNSKLSENTSNSSDKQESSDNGCCQNWSTPTSKVKQSQSPDEDEIAIEIEEFDDLYLRELLSKDESQKEKQTSKKKMKSPKKHYSRRCSSSSVEREKRLQESSQNYLNPESETYLERKSMIYEEYRFNRKDDQNRKDSLEEVNRKRQEIYREREIVRRQREYIRELKKEQERLRIRVRNLASLQRCRNFHERRPSSPQPLPLNYWHSPARSSNRRSVYEIDQEEAYRRRVDNFLRQTSMIKMSPMYNMNRSRSPEQNNYREKIKFNRSSSERNRPRNFPTSKNGFGAEKASHSSSYSRRPLTPEKGSESNRKRPRFNNDDDGVKGSSSQVQSCGGWETRNTDRLTPRAWDRKNNWNQRDKETTGQLWNNRSYPKTTPSERDKRGSSFVPKYSTNRYEKYKNGKY